MLMGESPSNSTFYMKKIKKIISVLCKSEKCHSGYHNLVGYSVFCILGYYIKNLRQVAHLNPIMY